MKRFTLVKILAFLLYYFIQTMFYYFQLIDFFFNKEEPRTLS